MLTESTGRACRLALLLAIAACSTPSQPQAPPSGAGEIRVTTTAGGVDPNDAETTLREAVAQANSNPGDDVIVLGNGLHELVDCTQGPLRVTEEARLTVRGSGDSSIRQTCADRAQWKLRAFSRTGDPAPTVTLALERVHLVGGPSSGAIAVSGMAVDASGERAVVELDDVEVSGFDTGGDGGSVIHAGSDAAGDHELVVAESTLRDNIGTVLTGDGTSVSLRGTTIEDNTGSGAAFTDGFPVEVFDSTIRGNTGTGLGSTGQGTREFALTLVDSLVSDNGHVGVSCSQCGRVTVGNSSIDGNGQTAPDACGGLWVELGRRSSSDASTLRIIDSTITGNRARDDAGGVTARAASPDSANALVPEITIRGSGMSDNVGAAGAGGLLVVDGSLRIEDSALSYVVTRRAD